LCVMRPDGLQKEVRESILMRRGEGQNAPSKLIGDIA